MKVELNFLEKFNLAKICLEVFMAFVRSGYVHTNVNSVFGAGEYGWAWPMTAFSPLTAYRLSFGLANVTLSSEAYRYYGFPLRCLYPGSA